jgi:hypothetical protein
MPLLANYGGGGVKGGLVNDDDSKNHLVIYLLIKLLFTGKSVLATSLQYRQFIYFYEMSRFEPRDLPYTSALPTRAIYTYIPVPTKYLYI